jgi:hypothetical protein
MGELGEMTGRINQHPRQDESHHAGDGEPAGHIIVDAEHVGAQALVERDGPCTRTGPSGPVSILSHFVSSEVTMTRGANPARVRTVLNIGLWGALFKADRAAKGRP